MADSRRFIEELSIDKLCKWLRTAYKLPNIDDCVHAITENQIDGQTFIHLNAELVSRLGVNIFHAPRILHLARNLQPSQEFDNVCKESAKEDSIQTQSEDPEPKIPTPGIKTISSFPALKCQKCQEIPTVAWTNTKKIFEFLEKQQPVIIKKSRLTGDCATSWNVDYLKDKIHGNCTVFSADSPWFRYWNEEKNFGKYPFQPPTKLLNISFSDFLEKVQEANEHNENSLEKIYLYMQHSLGKGCEDLSGDFADWKWDFLYDIIHRCGWVNLTANLLLIGMKDVLTPLHFDEQENLFCQLKGTKEVILFPPSNFENLYPFPQGHPCDRQSMIDVMNPDLEQFPRFKDATPYTAILEPGDCLYLPFMWWHQFRNLDNLSTSVTFWCITKPSDAEEVLKTGLLSDCAKVAVRRNLEKLGADHVGGWDKLNEAFTEILKETPAGKSLKEYLVDILSYLKIPRETRVKFVEQLIEGRYGVDHSSFVRPREFGFSV